MAKGQSLYQWCLENDTYGQKVINEWTGIEVDKDTQEIINTNVDMNDVTYASGRVFRLKCDKGHYYDRQIGKLTYNRRGCQYCGRERSAAGSMNVKEYTQSLDYWCKTNGIFGKKLAEHWTGEEVDNDLNCINNNVSMQDVRMNSTRKFKFNCENGHTYYQKISNKVNNKAGCNYCVNSGTSYPEQFLYMALKQLYPDTENRCKVLKSEEHNQGIEFDIGIPSIPLCIEYSPTIWHDDKSKIDNYKKEICEKFGVRLIQIIVDSYNEFDETFSENFICFRMDTRYEEKILVRILEYILSTLGRDISEIDIQSAIENAYNASHSIINKDQSIGVVYPDLAKEVLNKNIDVNKIHTGSHKIIQWVCPKCNYGADGNWAVAVATRTYSFTGCPSCGWNWYSSSYNKNVNKPRGLVKNEYKELLKEIDMALNPDLDLDKLTCGAHTKVNFKCTKCGYGDKGEWKADIHGRIHHKSSCPNCKYSIFIDDYKGAKAYSKKNGISKNFKNLEIEWHKTLNKLSPYEVTGGSSKDKIYWQCVKCGHGANGEWLTTPNSRTYGKSGCPKCGYNSFYDTSIINEEDSKNGR